MNIGEVAAASGISAKMIRHYEAIGLIRPAGRSGSGYRRFLPADVETLRFVHRARAAGFSLRETGELVRLWLDRSRPAREVRRIAGVHLAELRSRIEALQAIAGPLAHLVDHCHGDERPECPILEAFAGKSEEAAGAAPQGKRGRPRRRVKDLRSDGSVPRGMGADRQGRGASRERR